MTTTICGHDRENLKCALRVAEYQGEETAMRMCNSVAKVAFAFPDDTRLAIERDVLWAIVDPARLAKVLGETLRGFGLPVDGDECDEKQTYVDVDRGGMSNIITVKTTDPDGHQSWFDYTMPQARALELRLLSLPNGATADDALKVLEVRT